MTRKHMPASAPTCPPSLRAALRRAPRTPLAEHPLIDGHNDPPWAAREQVVDFGALDIAGPPDTDRPPHLRRKGVRVGASSGRYFPRAEHAAGRHDHAGTVDYPEQVDGVHRRSEMSSMASAHRRRGRGAPKSGRIAC